MPTFEVPVFSAAAAHAAVVHGATRLEINRAGSYAAGGLTPTRSELFEAVRLLATVLPEIEAVPVRVMIRSRGAPTDGTPDFVYTDAELASMQAVVAAFRASGMLAAARGDGFVFGVVRADGHLDVARCRVLTAAAGPLVSVLHRAADALLEPDHGERLLADARTAGFAAILTAGGTRAEGAPAHKAALQQLVTAAAGVSNEAPLEIIVGGGVRSGNVAALAETVQSASSSSAASVAFHASCLVRGSETVDTAEVARMRAVLDRLE